MAVINSTGFKILNELNAVNAFRHAGIVCRRGTVVHSPTSAKYRDQHECDYRVTHTINVAEKCEGIVKS